MPPRPQRKNRLAREIMLILKNSNPLAKLREVAGVDVNNSPILPLQIPLI
jgi:hypothetical protein